MCKSQVTHHSLAKVSNICIVSNICRLSYVIFVDWVATPWRVLLWGGDKSYKLRLIHPKPFSVTQRSIAFIIWRHIISLRSPSWLYDLHPAQLREGVASNWWSPPILASFLEYIGETWFTKTTETGLIPEVNFALAHYKLEEVNFIPFFRSFSPLRKLISLLADYNASHPANRSHTRQCLLPIIWCWV